MWQTNLPRHDKVRNPDMTTTEGRGSVFDPWGFTIEPRQSALLIIDMQYLDAHRDYGRGLQARERGLLPQYEYYFRQIETVVTPNIRRLLDAARSIGIDPIFPRIASLVQDCRDVSREHKRINLMAAAGSRESEILEELKPRENEIVISKGASGIFNSTAIDQILRNLGKDTLIITGVVTNYCVETAVRDAADRGYNVVLVSDACAAKSEEHQRLALEVMGGVYCLVKTTEELLQELGCTSGP